MRPRFALLLAFLAIAGCGTPPALVDTSWSLPLPKGSGCDALPYLEFSKTNVTGDLGCNRFSARYRLQGDRIHFENPTLTKKLCDGKTMQVERRMLDAIQGARRLEQSEKTLRLLDHEGKVLMQMVPETLGACH